MLELMRSLVNHGGVTLKNGKEILYKSGWQVADYDVECKTAEDAAKAVEHMNGNCGVWLENGIYYVDHSFRVDSKKKAKALEIGQAHNQISIYGWKKENLAYC